MLHLIDDLCLFARGNKWQLQKNWIVDRTGRGQFEKQAILALLEAGPRELNRAIRALAGG